MKIFLCVCCVCCVCTCVCTCVYMCVHVCTVCVQCVCVCTCVYMCVCTCQTGCTPSRVPNELFIKVLYTPPPACTCVYTRVYTVCVQGVPFHASHLGLPKKKNKKKNVGIAPKRLMGGNEGQQVLRSVTGNRGSCVLVCNFVCVHVCTQHKNRGVHKQGVRF